MKLKTTVTIIISLILISIFFQKKFYGFEYEDSFINPCIATSENYFSRIDNFRTAEFTKLIDKKYSEKKSYPGHYMPYSYYLYIINKIFIVPEYMVHKIANLILVFLSFLLILTPRKKDINFKMLFIFSLFSSLPFIYILNSALIENLSFFLGILFFTVLRYYDFKINSDFKKSILFFLILVLSLVKRENLIYLLTIPLFINLEDLKNKKIIFSLIIFLCVQLYINPFFTEGIESNSLKTSTFSFEYLQFQLPTYLLSLISIQGFVSMTLLLIIIKPNPRSIYIFMVWITFILFYSFHYRSRYAIASKSITIFETYRYLINTIPLFFGVIIFSELRKNKIKYLSYLIFVFFSIKTFFSFKQFQDFTREEYINYHLVNDLLNKENSNKKIIIYDNFVLISLLNSKNKNIDILELNNIDNIPQNKNVYIINRFDEFDLKNNPNFIPIKKFSFNETIVYKFK